MGFFDDLGAAGATRQREGTLAAAARSQAKIEGIPAEDAAKRVMEAEAELDGYDSTEDRVAAYDLMVQADKRGVSVKEMVEADERDAAEAKAHEASLKGPGQMTNDDLQALADYDRAVQDSREGNDPGAGGDTLHEGEATP